MIYHFVILSPEDEEFCREVLVDADHTFEQLHNCIQDSVNYDKGQLASFFMLNENWEKEQEITLMPMDQLGEEPLLLMADTRISDLIQEKKQRLHYVFDYFGNRGFFIELLNIGANRNLADAKCVNSVGNPPEQILMEEMGMDDWTDIMDNEEEENDPFNVDDEFDDIRYDDLDEEDYSQLF